MNYLRVDQHEFPWPGDAPAIGAIVETPVGPCLVVALAWALYRGEDPRGATVWIRAQRRVEG
jgi:hypothetical protein